MCHIYIYIHTYTRIQEGDEDKGQSNTEAGEDKSQEYCAGTTQECAGTTAADMSFSELPSIMCGRRIRQVCSVQACINLYVQRAEFVKLHIHSHSHRYIHTRITACCTDTNSSARLLIPTFRRSWMRRRYREISLQ